MRRNIHFSVISKINQKGVRGYDPLFKVSCLLKIMIKGMRGVRTSVNHVTIDNIMIKYMGRAITYVQYMHVKPIKHGIKVFAICCDISTILIGFKVYFFQEDHSRNIAMGIFDDIVKEAGITTARGHTIYTNNYCTSMALAKHMFNKYVWTIVGAIIPMYKKSCANHDIPFFKLSNVSRNSLK